MVVLHSPEPTGTTSTAIKWCAVGHAETSKCDTWSINSVDNTNTAIECQNAPTVEECLKKIMVKQSSVTTLGFVFVQLCGICL